MLPVIEEFNYISNETFRQCVESDWRELNEALQTKSWKAAMVLGGSIIEAMLADSLYSESGGTNGVLRLDLSELIDDCHSKKIIKDDTKKACEVIKDFRNLIHPGRTVRMGSSATEGKASLTRSLVLIVAGDIAANRKATYGYTAEQVLAKMYNDPNGFFSVIDSVLSKVNDNEKAALLLKHLPDEHRLRRVEIAQERNAERREPIIVKLRSVRRTYQAVYATSHKQLQQRAAQVYYNLLLQGGEEERKNHERGLLLPAHIQVLSESEKAVVRTGILASIRTDCIEEALFATGRLGPWFTDPNCWGDLIQTFYHAHRKFAYFTEEWMSGLLRSMDVSTVAAFKDQVAKDKQMQADPKLFVTDTYDRILALPDNALPF